MEKRNKRGLAVNGIYTARNLRRIESDPRTRLLFIAWMMDSLARLTA
jgi:hypothetical protein